MSKRVITINTGRQTLVVRLETGWRGTLIARCSDPKEAGRIAAALDPDHVQEETDDA